MAKNKKGRKKPSSQTKKNRKAKQLKDQRRKITQEAIEHKETEDVVEVVPEEAAHVVEHIHDYEEAITLIAEYAEEGIHRRSFSKRLAFVKSREYGSMSRLLLVVLALFLIPRGIWTRLMIRKNIDFVGLSSDPYKVDYSAFFSRLTDRGIDNILYVYGMLKQRKFPYRLYRLGFLRKIRYFPKFMHGWKKLLWIREDQSAVGDVLVFSRPQWRRKGLIWKFFGSVFGFDYVKYPEDESQNYPAYMPGLFQTLYVSAFLRNGIWKKEELKYNRHTCLMFTPTILVHAVFWFLSFIPFVVMAYLHNSIDPRFLVEQELWYAPKLIQWMGDSSMILELVIPSLKFCLFIFPGWVVLATALTTFRSLLDNGVFDFLIHTLAVPVFILAVVALVVSVTGLAYMLYDVYGWRVLLFGTIGVGLVILLVYEMILRAEDGSGIVKYPLILLVACVTSFALVPERNIVEGVIHNTTVVSKEVPTVKDNKVVVQQLPRSNRMDTPIPDRSDVKAVSETSVFANESLAPQYELHTGDDGKTKIPMNIGLLVFVISLTGIFMLWAKVITKVPYRIFQERWSDVCTMRNTVIVHGVIALIAGLFVFRDGYSWLTKVAVTMHMALVVTLGIRRFRYFMSQKQFERGKQRLRELVKFATPYKFNSSRTQELVGLQLVHAEEGSLETLFEIIDDEQSNGKAHDLFWNVKKNPSLLLDVSTLKDNLYAGISKPKKVKTVKPEPVQETKAKEKPPKNKRSKKRLFSGTASWMTGLCPTLREHERSIQLPPL